MTASRLLMACALLSVFQASAIAQSARSGGTPSANPQQMQQLQQLASERTQLQAENAKMKKELEDLKQQVKTLTADKQTLTQRAANAAAVLSRSGDNKEALEQSLQQQRARMEELVGKFRETATTLREVETERATAQAQLKTREQELSSCVQKNVELYKLNGEVIDHLEHKGVFSSLAEKEPFTQIKRIRNENLAEEFKGRADDQRIETPAKK